MIVNMVYVFFDLSSSLIPMFNMRQRIVPEQKI